MSGVTDTVEVQPAVAASKSTVFEVKTAQGHPTDLYTVSRACGTTCVALVHSEVAPPAAIAAACLLSLSDRALDHRGKTQQSLLAGSRLNQPEAIT